MCISSTGSYIFHIDDVKYNQATDLSAFRWQIVSDVKYILPPLPAEHMMTSSNGNIFRVTGHLCGEVTGHRWIPHTKASDAELWCFLSAPE